MSGVAAFIEREQRIGAQIDAIADAAGALNVANARLVAVMADVLTERSWAGSGVHTATQWLTYHAGVTTARARTIIDVAGRRAVFPVVIGRFDAGELSLEQVAELVKAPAWADAKLVDWALVATPARIRRSIEFGSPPTTTTPATVATPATPILTTQMMQDTQRAMIPSPVLPIPAPVPANLMVGVGVSGCRPGSPTSIGGGSAVSSTSTRGC